MQTQMKRCSESQQSGVSRTCHGSILFCLLNDFSMRTLRHGLPYPHLHILRRHAVCRLCTQVCPHSQCFCMCPLSHHLPHSPLALRLYENRIRQCLPLSTSLFSPRQCHFYTHDQLAGTGHRDRVILVVTPRLVRSGLMLD